jgi:DnaJ-class molecular chaperone
MSQGDGDEPGRPAMSPDDDQATDAETCSPCRGTGKLISGLGGTPHEVTCPWCQGTGKRIPGIDAQEHPAEAGPSPDQS